MNRKYPLIVVAVLVLGTLLLYWPVTKHAFVNWDDPEFVTANPHVQAGLTWEGIKWAFNIHTAVACNWHPVTMLTHMLDCQLFGMDAGKHHLTNVLFHIANTLLLFIALRRMTGSLWRSGFVAAMFAWHPLHVESVAWVAERKDVLSTFWGLLTVIAYTRFTKCASESHQPGFGKIIWYLLALLCFIMGLLSKPMLVTLPFVLVLLDRWPLERIRTFSLRSLASSMFEKLPFFILTAIFCVITYSMQNHGGAVMDVTRLSFGSRMGNALIAYIRYIEKMFWPHHLAGLYMRHENWPLWLVIIAAVILLVITVVAVAQTTRRGYLATGWLWYVGTLVPVIGIVQVGAQTMADRYTYVPLIGLFIIIAWGAGELVNRWKIPAIAPAGAATVVLIACLILTSRQIPTWKDSETLFKRMIAVTDRNYLAYYNLGNLYVRQNKLADAVACYEESERYGPNYADTHNNLAVALMRQREYDHAIDHHQKAVQLGGRSDYFFNYGNTLMAVGRHTEAVAPYRQASALDHRNKGIHHNLAIALAYTGHSEEAIAEFQQGHPETGEKEAAIKFADILYKNNRLDAAIGVYRVASRLNPERADIQHKLDLLLESQRENSRANEMLRK